jgi:leucyl aminopeptidase
MKIITSQAAVPAVKKSAHTPAPVKVEIAHDPNGRPRVVEVGKQLLLRYPAKKKQYLGRAACKFVRGIVRLAQKEGIRALHLNFTDFRYLIGGDSDEAAELLGRELVNANYNFTKYMAVPEGGHPSVDSVYIANVDETAHRNTILNAAGEGGGMNVGREIGNEPANVITPAALGRIAKANAKGTRVTVKVFSLQNVKGFEMNLMQSVGKASENAPRLIVMEYWGRGRGKPVDTAFVGKAVCFDSGGLSLKPTDGMKHMHLDKCGGVLAMTAVMELDRRKAKVNAVAVIGAVENSVSGRAYRPSDIIKSGLGPWVKILNTDAEGRLVLADLLYYTGKKYQPKKAFTLATLTGAAVVALGDHYTGGFSMDEKLMEDAVIYGQGCGNLIWPLPLDPEIHMAYLKTDGADLANIRDKGDPKAGGASSAAMFLQHFATLAGIERFMHFDIAPRMTAASDDELDPGATMEPSPVLVKLATMS